MSLPPRLSNSSSNSSSGTEYQVGTESEEPLFFQTSYRLSKLYHVCLPMISISAILYFLIYRRGFLSFNKNIKILFYIQFFSCFLHSFVSGVGQTHHFIISILATNSIDVTLSPLFYTILTIPFTFSLFGTSTSLLIMIAERTLSSYYFHFYEKYVRRIGLFMIIAAVLTPFLITVFIYCDGKFDYPVITVIATQPSGAARVNIIFVFHIIFYIINLFHSIRLKNFNKMMNGSPRSKTSLGLSSKFQMSENATSSKILWQLIFLQSSIYLFYATSIFLIRVFVPRPRPAFWTVITEMCYTPPIYCAVMPILCIYTTTKSKEERNRQINTIVSMRSTGTEGWDNYQKMLKEQWA